MWLLSITPWLDSELSFVADSGLGIGYCFALEAENCYKGESPNAAILRRTKNAPVPVSRGMNFGYRGEMNRSIDSLITLLLGFWCCTITFLLYEVSGGNHPQSHNY